MRTGELSSRPMICELLGFFLLLTTIVRENKSLAEPLEPILCGMIHRREQ